MLTIKPSIMKDAKDLAPRLREADRLEVEAAGSTPVASLRLGIKHSFICNSVFEDDKIIGIFGATKKFSPKGYCAIWFLGSDESENYPLAFVKQGKNLINEVMKNYSIINMVYSKNTTHIEYLKRIGLTVDTDKAVTFPTNEIFYPFYKLKEV